MLRGVVELGAQVLRLLLREAAPVALHQVQRARRRFRRADHLVRQVGIDSGVFGVSKVNVEWTLCPHCFGKMEPCFGLSKANFGREYAEGALNLGQPPRFPRDAQCG